MNVLTELTHLAVGRPRAGATAETVAEWYEAKSRLHAHLAGLGGPDSELERALAERAHKRATDLLSPIG
ncbi:hypothetical protein [Smaragdicoccus niigatensis]|uniref:hypothetical protein n=1 Tax=Smaragdicoccus niigatensis TaxID=359359 RepID=UPI000368D916|nr:hypothetical protein [Smaragdicoccus niigatensis]